MKYPSRSTDVATPEELGHDIRPDPVVADLPEDERHDIERIKVPEDAERYPGYEFDKCMKCGKNSRALDPYERCPGDTDDPRVAEHD